MKSRAAAKGRSLLFLAAVCLVSTLLLAPAAEASRSLPAALAPPLSPPAMPDLVIEESTAEPQPRHRLFGDLDRLERPLDVVPIQKTASGVFSLGIQSNIQQAGGLEQNRSGPSFQGLWTDPVTGIAHARNRWYDARTASWLSEDPLEDVDSPNLYAFVGWGPQSGRDPMGLAEDWNYTPEAKEFKRKEAAANQFRQAVGWMSDNNEAYAYAKSRRSDLDVDDPEFRELLQEWFEEERGDCRDAWIFKSTAYWDCHARVEVGFPLSPEGILEARKNNRWFGDEQMMMLGAWGEFFENVGMMEAWWALGGAIQEFLALEGVANVNQIIRDVQAPRIHYLGKPGLLTFEGMEVRAVRSLSHVDESTLKAMAEHGFAAKDIHGNKLVLHHFKQNPAGPVIEIPLPRHSIGNRVQHPFGNMQGAGLSAEQRAVFDAWRVEYWKARAQMELARRGLL